MRLKKKKRSVLSNLVPRAFPLKKWVEGKSPGDEVAVLSTLLTLAGRGEGNILQSSFAPSFQTRSPGNKFKLARWPPRSFAKFSKCELTFL